jgi:outer membrane murein-binding lipoprotein Lpp
MDQSQMLSIIGGFYDKLVSDVANVVVSRLNAAGAAQIALDSDAFKQAVRTMLEDDSGARDTIRDIVSDSIDGHDFSDNREFRSLADKVDELDTEQDDLKSKVDELEEQSIDADNDEFADAVRAVIRNNI